MNDEWFADVGIEIKLTGPTFRYVKDGVTYTFDNELNLWVGDNHTIYPSLMAIP